MEIHVTPTVSDTLYTVHCFVARFFRFTLVVFSASFLGVLH